MIVVPPRKGSIATAVICAAALAFGILTAFEVKIAQAEARSDSASSDMLAQERLLRSGQNGEPERRNLERRIAAVGLRGDPLDQEVRLVRALQSIASRHGLQLLAIRARPFERVPRARTRFEARSYEVILQGAYRGILVALGDLSGVPLVTRLERIDLARAEDATASPAMVRAMLQLAIVRLTADRDVRADSP